MKKAERKKQLREHILVAVVIVAMNLVWMLLFANKFYANYIEGNYIEYWPKLRIHEKTVVMVSESDYTILVPMGQFMLTAYCPCDLCCEVWADKRPKDEEGTPIVIGAAGTILEEGKSIAVDPDVIPYGTKVLIKSSDQWKEYVAADCGGDIKGNWIDIYMEDHERAKKYGVKYAEVYIVYDSNTGT